LPHACAERNRRVAYELVEAETMFEVHDLGLFLFGEREVWEKRTRLDEDECRSYRDELCSLAERELTTVADVLDVFLGNFCERDLVDEELARLDEFEKKRERSLEVSCATFTAVSVS
jgi:hypothetical protein